MKNTFYKVLGFLKQTPIKFSLKLIHWLIEMIDNEDKGIKYLI
jgi:hypothetical protein